MNSVSSSNNLGLIAHIGSIQNEDSGRWIALSPKFPNYVMTSSEIRISLLRRCFLAQPSITPGLHCNCSAQPLLDIQDRHFTTDCCKGAHRIECHDNLKNTINSICRYSGCSTRVEERNCFSNITIDNATNNNHDDGDGRRPDLSVSNFKNGNNKDLLLDICVTQSYPGSKKCSPSLALKPTQSRFRIHQQLKPIITKCRNICELQQRIIICFSLLLLKPMVISINNYSNAFKNSLHYRPLDLTDQNQQFSVIFATKFQLLYKHHWPSPSKNIVQKL
jgi:hypothetical protein